MKKIFIGFLVMSIFFSGCANIARKFIRKKKRKVLTPVYVRPQDYPTLDSKELYLDYYVYIKGWMQDLTSALREGISRKKIISSSQGVIDNLTYLKEFFPDDKIKTRQIDDYIDAFSKIKSTYQNKKDTPVLKEKFIYQTERLQRDFEKKFKYSSLFK